LADGTGTSKTAQISIVMTSYADQALLEITNNDAADVYLTLAKLRGTALANLSGTAATAGDATSQAAYEKQGLTINSRWVQEAVEAQNYAGYVVLILKDPQRVVYVRVFGYPAFQFGPDLFDVITFSDTLLSIPATDYVITYIEHDYNVKRGCITTFRLEPKVSTDYWVLGESLLGTETILGW